MRQMIVVLFSAVFSLQSSTAQEMRALIEQYVADRGSMSRMYTVEVSQKTSERMARFCSDWLAKLSKLPFDSFDQENRADYVLLKNHIQKQRRQLELDGKNFDEVKDLMPFANGIVELEEGRQRAEPVDGAKTAATLNELRKSVEESRKKAEAESTHKKTAANRAASIIGDLRRDLRHWYDFYSGYDPTFTWWNEVPFKALDEALSQYGTFIREKIVGVKPNDTITIIGDPIGKEALLAELQFEMIPYTPEELVEIANKEFAWCEKEMLRASRDLGYGDDWKKALEHVKQQFVEPGKQPQIVRELAAEAIAFVEKNSLVTVPELAKETWRMEMMSPQQQLVSPFFLGGEVIQVAFPTNEMAHEAKLMSLRGNNIHFARATVHHELIPGHHLQGFMTDRYRPYRQLFGTPFWGEGWALYWEMLLWDKKFYEFRYLPEPPRNNESNVVSQELSARNRIGMLFWRMHRCARIIFSLSFHLEKMTPQECIDFLVDKVGHERDNASAEVRRSVQGGYGPLYQCAYMLGGLQIRSLHKELVDSGKMTDRAFHDKILQSGPMPISVLRCLLTGKKIEREFPVDWRFAG